MEAIEVKKTVNSPKNEGPGCIEPDLEGIENAAGGNQKKEGPGEGMLF
jgi:hypothetical protein